MLLTCMGELIDLFPGVPHPSLCSDEQIILEEELSSVTGSVLADVRKHSSQLFYGIDIEDLYTDLPQ